MKSASANVFLDLLTMLALSDELRTLNESAQVERAARRSRCFDSDTRARCGSVTVEELVSSASGLSVPRCIRGW